MNGKSSLLVVAGVVGFLGVLLGAAGKHALKDAVDDRLMSGFETGLRYHQVHGVALLAVAVGSLSVTGRVRQRRLRVAGWLLLAGIVVFCGSLYLMAFTGKLALGRVTPVGGVLLMLGWLSLAWAGLPARDSPGLKTP